MNFIQKKAIDRRTLLRGMGAAAALPLLDAMVPAATALATKPLGPLPKGASAPDLAAWTVVANVLLNLDEMLMNR